MKTGAILAATLLTSLLTTSCAQPGASPMPTSEPTPETSAATTNVDAEVFVQFEDELEDLRQQHKIPGFSAAIVKGQELVWAKGFGYADVENKVEATPDTPYHLASVTKPFAATIIMQLVEEGALDVEDLVSEYGVEVESSGVVRVKHLLTHTSEGNPGSQYKYNGDRFGRLSQVIQQASGKSFQELLFERILEPLGMTNTAPNPGGCSGLDERGSTCDRVYSQMAKPYKLDPLHDIAEGVYHDDYFGAAAGLVSTVVDLAKFDMAMDRNLLVSQETKEQMFRPTVSTGGSELPYGLGWFTQRYQGTRLIWHYGYWSPSVSSLILKVPEENITLIILANTDNLSRPYRLGDGDVFNSPVALAFYERFVFEPRTGQAVPEINWATEADPSNRIRQYAGEDLRALFEKELESYQMLSKSMDGVEQVGRRIAAKLATDVDPRVYDAYVGQYEMPAEMGLPFASVTVTSEDDKLYLEIPEGSKLELFPQSETRFFHLSFEGTVDDFEVTFIRDETGQVTQFVSEIDRQEFTHHRINH